MAWLICAIPAYTTSYSYDGQTLTNDGTWSYTWQHGRQLAQMSKPNGSGTENVNYTYDAQGHRIAKEHETTGSIDGDSYRYAFTAKYTYLGDTLTDMQWVEVDGSVSSFHFTYDATGPMSMTFYGTEYFYLKNAQGDVTGLVDSSGTQVVAYTYDAWGNILSTTGSMADGLGYTNPFRYRGYFYDTETGLYYLQSRYYNPQWGRFVNADGYTSTGQGIIGNNMFAYCGNNPQSRTDQDGYFWREIGDFFKGVAEKIVSGVKSFFGVKSSTTVIEKEEKTVIPDPSPITIKHGVKTSSTVSSSGDDSRPISVYQQTVANDFASSTVGIKANIGHNTYDYSIGINNTSLSHAICMGNTTQKIALRVNVQELKIGIESSTTVKWDGYSTTTYTNVSVSAWFLAAGYYFVKTGQWTPSPGYVSR